MLTIHDQHGKRMFGEVDMGRLCHIPANVVDPILDVARRLSGMAPEEIEELVKNSQTAQAAAESGSNTD